MRTLSYALGIMTLASLAAISWHATAWAQNDAGGDDDLAGSRYGMAYEDEASSVHTEGGPFGGAWTSGRTADDPGALTEDPFDSDVDPSEEHVSDATASDAPLRASERAAQIAQAQQAAVTARVTALQSRISGLESRVDEMDDLLAQQESALAAAQNALAAAQDAAKTKAADDEAAVPIDNGTATSDQEVARAAAATSVGSVN